MIKAIRNILMLFLFAILAIVGVGLYRQYVAPNEGVPEQAATTRPVTQTGDEGAARRTMASPPVDEQSGGVSVEMPSGSDAEFFALSVKLIDTGVVEIKSRREEGAEVAYFVHLVTCTTLRTGVVAASKDLAGLANRNETPAMEVPAEGSAELMLSQIACASVEN